MTFEIFVLLDCVALRGTDWFYEQNPYLFLFSTTMYKTIPNLSSMDIDVCKHHTHTQRILQNRIQGFKCPTGTKTRMYKLYKWNIPIRAFCRPFLEHTTISKLNKLNKLNNLYL